jgi:hypothetical protein
MRASVEDGGKSVSQYSQFGLNSSAIEYLRIGLDSRSDNNRIDDISTDKNPAFRANDNST